MVEKFCIEFLSENVVEKCNMLPSQLWLPSFGVKSIKREYEDEAKEEDDDNDDKEEEDEKQEEDLVEELSWPRCYFPTKENKIQYLFSILSEVVVKTAFYVFSPSSSLSMFSTPVFHFQLKGLLDLYNRFSEFCTLYI